MGGRAEVGTPEVIELWAAEREDLGSGKRPFLEVFRPFVAKRALPVTIIVIPGGGFGGLSPYERSSAEYFRSLGYTAVLLHYRVTPNRHPASFADAARAVRLMRRQIPENCVVAFGSSAGGHLAAMIGTQPDLYQDSHDDLRDSVSARPDGLILLYPVISAVEPFAYASFHRLIGEEASRAMKETVSPERHVTDRTPPALLIHAADDAVVRVENSIVFAQACWRAGVGAELHVFPRGGHGRVFSYDPELSPRWRALVQEWLRHLHINALNMH